MTQNTAHRNLSMLAKCHVVNRSKFLEKIFFRGLCFIAGILAGIRRENRRE
jgi:hypothetical protein